MEHIPSEPEAKPCDSDTSVASVAAVAAVAAVALSLRITTSLALASLPMLESPDPKHKGSMTLHVQESAR